MFLLRSTLPKVVLSATIAAILAGCGGDDDSVQQRVGYKQTVVVSDGGVASSHTDANLKNGWGIAFNPQGFVWVADAGSQKSTLYDGDGTPQQLVVSIPAGVNGPAGPTGIVFSGASNFELTQNGTSGSSAFIFATLAGTIAAWSPSVNLTSAVTVYDDATGGAQYTGLAIGSDNGANRLYAADFHNNKIDVFDNSFQKISTIGRFVDPSLPAGFAPFGIQAVGSDIFVAYAKQDSSARNAVHAVGQGLIDVYDSGGTFKKRLITGGNLNAPWGIAPAPVGFGPLSNKLLIGNFGDGTIHAYDPQSGAEAGTLTQKNGAPITIPGLWGIGFGNGLNAQPTNTLFFAAGPNRGLNGIYGRLDVDQ
ncbi:TIGR03118 family protein [Burkholderia sp. Ac-20345]|uniref:TIGR03118 family protein n=1 Tax=Burkholderia sp. Ac-20345 TaxID=2703891 RepID=UPI00197C69EE|nr:TIGR03118 family protein [Burkholderia sp. Ac-20345]MBN3782141.1 TIGR03118 family protein [Burkholderia sp. Ac-20345]